MQTHNQSGSILSLHQFKHLEFKYFSIAFTNIMSERELVQPNEYLAFVDVTTENDKQYK